MATATATATAVLLAAALLALAGAAASERGCSSGGLLCERCDLLVLCVQTSVGFQRVEVEQCPEDFPCSQSELRCSNKTSFCTLGDLQGFQCRDIGRYPDPYDCNLFYDCGPLPEEGGDGDRNPSYNPDASQVCPSGKAYNPGTGECDLPMSHGSCTEHPPVPPCDPNGRFSAGPLPLNASIYFICLAGKPSLYTCPNGTVFDSKTLACVEPESPQPPTSDPTPAPTTTPGEPASTPWSACPGVGKFPYGDDCYKYINCLDPSNPRLASCMVGRYFDRNLLECVIGRCPYK